MSKKIMKKCPNCGYWCEAESKNALQRFINKSEKTVKGTSKFGEKYLGGLGRFAGTALGSCFAAHEGVLSALIDHKFQFNCPRCGALWSTNDESADETNLYEFECELTDLFDEFASACHVEKNKIESYLLRIQAKLSDDRNTDMTKVLLQNLMAAAYYEMSNTEKSIFSVNEALKIAPEYPLSLAIKGYVMGGGRNAADSFAALNSLIRYKEFAMDEQSNAKLYTREQFHDRFVEIQNRYISEFLSIPVEQRRFIYLVDGNLDDKLKSLPQTVKLLPLSNLPTELEIVGMPQDNVLYICHPYKNNNYIPADEYQLELIRDELHEFCHVMECLGAKQISLSDTHTNQQDESYNKSTNVHVEGGYKDYSGNVGGDKQTSESLNTMIRKELSEQHEFLCSKDIQPYVPKDTVWYSHRQEWQRKVSSRLEGRLIKDVYTIATSHSETISGAKKLAIEAEVNALVASLSVGYEGSSDFTIKQSESFSQQVEVEFYPMSE